MSGQTTNLLIYLRQMGPMSGWRALHCHISGLPKSLRTRDTLTRAVQVLNELGGQATMAKVFVLNTFDIVIVAFNLDSGLMRQAASDVHRIFGWTPPESANVYGGLGFSTIIELASDSRLIGYAEAVVAADSPQNQGDAA